MRKSHCYADGGLVGGFIDRVTKPFRKPEGYVSVREEEAARAAAATSARAAAPAPAPAAVQLGGMNLSALQRREKEAGLKDGGVIRGPGTGTSDSIARKMLADSFILPADSTEAMNGDGEGKKVPVRVSNGETAFNPKMVQAVGAAALMAVLKATHTPADQQEEDAEGESQGAYADGGMLRPRSLANGGMVGDTEDQPSSSYSEQMSKVGNFLVDAAGTGVKTIVSAPGYGFNSDMRKPAPVAAVNKVGPTDEVGKPAMTSAAGAGRGIVNPPMASSAGNARSDLANVPSLAGSTGVAVDGAAGVRKFKTADGRTLYSNVAGADNDVLMSKNPGVQVAPGFAGSAAALMAGTSDNSPAAINNRAAATYRDMAEISKTLDEPGAMSNGSGMRVVGTTNGLFRAPNDPGTPSLSAMGLSPKDAARLANAKEIAQLQADTSQANSRESNQTARYGADVGARTAADRLAAETAQAQPKVGLARQQLASAQNLDRMQAQYAASTDEAERAQLRERIMLAQGKERDFQNRFTVVPGGQEIVDGQVVRTPSRVLNNQTGEFVETADASGAGGRPAVGAVKNGFRYKGGNPSDKSSWEKV